MSENAFLNRVLQKLPRGKVSDYLFQHWSVPGKVTDEAMGVLPVPGVDAKKFLAAVMNLDRYVGNIPHVVESRTVADPRFTAPQQVRLYQRVKIPLLGEVHQELKLELLGEKNGWEVMAWTMLE